MKPYQATKSQILEAVKKFVDVGTVREAKGITRDEMESIYSVGLGFYRTGNYPNAEKVFRFLCLFDHLNTKYWAAMGGVRQIRRDFAGAAEAYKFAIFLDIHNARAMYYLAECFVALGRKEDAIGTLDALAIEAPKDAVGREMVAKGSALKAKLEGKGA